MEKKEVTFTGKPCKKGHSGLRYKNGRACVTCQKEAAKKYDPEKRRKAVLKWKKNNKEKAALMQRHWRQALRHKESANHSDRYYWGSICHKKHNGLRYKSSGNCVTCQSENSKRYYLTKGKQKNAKT